jgi:Uma2 family endonuclease
MNTIRQPAAPPQVDFPTPPQNLPETDGIPLESDWHRLAMNLLIEVVRYFFRERTDFFAGGNMFIYFSSRQARDRDFRGPDFFYVSGVELDRDRPYWAVWDEDGRYPDVIIELSSPSTTEEDHTTKFRIYERTFHTREYFIYDPDTQLLEGWRLNERLRYQPITPNEQGRMWSEELGLWLGPIVSTYLRAERIFLRFFDAEGQMVPTFAEAEQQRADLALEEVERLRQELKTLRKRRRKPKS